jgi:hypothetical protein
MSLAFSLLIKTMPNYPPTEDDSRTGSRRRKAGRLTAITGLAS